MDIDYEKLKRDLKDYLGTAMSYNPMAIVELSKIENDSNSMLVQIAQKKGFNLYDYEKGKVKIL